MQKIFKYQLMSNTTYVSMPIGSRIISLQMQNGEPHIWAIVNPEIVRELVHIEIVPTGVELSEAILDGEFIGTFQTGNNGLVFHVFRLK